MIKIVIICPNILLFRILKIPSATPGDNLILWTFAVRSLTGPDSLVGWPQICGRYVISLPPKWGAPWGTLCYHSLIVGPFFRRLNVPLLKVYVRRAHGYSFLRFPDRCILTGRYHFGRERAKTCQYIHLVSCVAMFCEVAPARRIPFREGTPRLPPLSLSIHYAN